MQPEIPPPGERLPAGVFEELLGILGGPEEAPEEAIQELCRKYQEHAELIKLYVRNARSSPATLTENPHDATPPDPVRIGPYRILSVLGEGGMGTVYIAEQREPVRRRVALKVIKLGMDSRRVLRRFEAERQALAMMEHGNIAKVFEAGTTDRGQPYFVMEYVRGIPITEHCDQVGASVEERIELFRQVCSGVQHAHQKGVMHRDLKPSNVLVTVQEGRAVPKIIDFGLARATDHRLVEATIFSEQGLVIGTPEYMSPEQAGLGGQDVDTRTDVYSLGVLLYELLVGELPFSRMELRQAGLGEMGRMIKEDAPPRPSTRLSTHSDASEHAARRRRTDTRSLFRRLRGDLDWVVMKALEKDRTRRYATPEALAEDLLRHLHHEPVLAGPPSAGYRLRKLVRRYRGQVVAGALVFLSLVAGIVSFAIANRRANAEAAAAIAAREEARANEALANDRAIEAQRERQRADGEAAAALANLENFNRLANVVKLREAKAAEQDLYPAWPEKVEAMKQWLGEQAEPLERERRSLQEALDELRGRALVATAGELETSRRQHPRFSELAALRKKLRAFENAQAVRAGQASPDTVVLDAAVPEDAFGLNELAWTLVNPDRQEFGREAEGLALARLAWEKAQLEVGTELRANTADTLAWALFANGLDEEAIATSETALAAVPAAQAQEFQGYLDRLHGSIEAARGDKGISEIAGMAAEIETLEAEVSKAATPEWRFEADADQFLHDTLATLVDDITAFVQPETGELGKVRERLAWAERLAEISITSHQARWEEARQAIRSADGITASKLYAAEAPFDLEPQIGLVPIGMNPKSRLWEFYHLRSAADPTVIPEHDGDGNIPVTSETGIIFVLVPGGTFLMGAQQEDPAAPNYDPQAQPDEKPHQVLLMPYFLARHELTQAQWERLSGGEKPSQYGEGFRVPEMRSAVTPDHPVEQVSWEMCDQLLRRHGLELPLEAEWEYAARAGTTTPWSTGAEAASLAGHANIQDEAAFRSQPQWGDPAGFDDGFIIHAPVGSFPPNGFGLFDMEGNVSEWCHDALGSRASRINRGGGFSFSAQQARSAYRSNIAPAARYSVVGVRARRGVG